LDPRLIKETFSVVEPHAAKMSAYFYGRLFAENSRLRSLFPPEMDTQRSRFFSALMRIVWSADSLDTNVSYLEQLGRDHRKFGVQPEDYAAVGKALIAAVRRFSADAWTPAAEQSWGEAYEKVAEIMIIAAEEHGKDVPPWWIGEVVRHERRTDDIAVITVRPHQWLPYLPGQYVSIETPRWPRMWRSYSIANAPRDDGLLTFHVRAMPGGWVSGALVRHMRVGDRLRIGHAVGNMIFDSGSDRDMLCVAGGTGLAPIKAIVEYAITRGVQRPIHLFVGARTARELYDWAELSHLATIYPWLWLVPAVSEDPTYTGIRGQLPEVVSRRGVWTDHDAYVCGPDQMVRQTIMRLLDVGVSPTRIRYDEFGDMFF
jgi:NAD(P)H-flavin reductase/hemoglobin-like flavoprotein